MSNAKPIQEATRISYQNVRIHWIAVTLIQHKVEPKQRNVHITTLQELHQFYHQSIFQWRLLTNTLWSQ